MDSGSNSRSQSVTSSNLPQMRKGPEQTSQKRAINGRVTELERKVQLLEASVKHLMGSSETAPQQHQPSKTTFAQATPQSVSSQHDKSWGAEEVQGVYSANIHQMDTILGDHSWLQKYGQIWALGFGRLLSYITAAVTLASTSINPQLQTTAKRREQNRLSQRRCTHLSHLERRVKFLTAAVKFIIESRKMQIHERLQELQTADLYYDRISEDDQEDDQETAEYET
uniref:Uncharacterized protein n=1 Tax=Talaromyces marneffei PM1 TaxID=1077442 RepID=A0A093UQJ4_TALMA